MLTPLQMLTGIWLAAWPALGGALPPASRLAVSSPNGAARVESVVWRDDRSPVLSMDDEELMEVLRSDPASLGSLSLGTVAGGMLFNAVELTTGPRWTAAPNAQTWATSETIDALQTAIDTVHELFPETPPIYVGDMSAQAGGRLKRHASHQSGRDVDLGFYYRGAGGSAFAAGNASNLDLPRNWALVRALVVRTDVESILLDTRIQKALYRYAKTIAEDSEWLDRVFGFVRGSRDAIIKHVAGHRTHYHVRFFSPVAQELGRRAEPLLLQLQLIDPPARTVRHVVRPGDTIGRLAERYGTTVQAIMHTNGLRTERLRARRAYRIPVRGAFPPREPLVMRHRLLPADTPGVMSAVEWPTAETLYAESPAPLER